jgi:hypothetical protein
MPIATRLTFGEELAIKKVVIGLRKNPFTTITTIKVRIDMTKNKSVQFLDICIFECYF